MFSSIYKNTWFSLRTVFILKWRSTLHKAVYDHELCEENLLHRPYTKRALALIVYSRIESESEIPVRG
jgi:hypothetical protein